MFSSLRFSIITLAIVFFLVLSSCDLFRSSYTNTENSVIEQPDTISDVDYVTSLGLMQGHLLAAKQLLEGGSSDQAQYHIDHPLSELYGGIESRIKGSDLDFYSFLERFYDVVKIAPYGDDAETLLQESVEGIERVIESNLQDGLQSKQLIIDCMNDILHTAAEEYEAGLGINGKIVAPIEYQDSSGFFLYLQKKFLNRLDGQTRSLINPSFNELAKAWTPINSSEVSVYPPDIPRITPQKVFSLVEDISFKSTHTKSPPA